jgi:hypothetical protein
MKRKTCMNQRRLKRYFSFSGLHGVTSQKTELFSSLVCSYTFLPLCLCSVLLEVHRTQVEVSCCGMLHIRRRHVPCLYCLRVFRALACLPCKNDISSICLKQGKGKTVLIFSEPYGQMITTHIFLTQKVSVSNLHPDAAFLIEIFMFLFRIFEGMM